MALDEALFGWLWRRGRKLRGDRRQRDGHEPAALESIVARLEILAAALCGEPMRVRPAERSGGVCDDALFLPSEFRVAPDVETNLALYVYRVAFGSFARPFCAVIPAASGPREIALHTLLAAGAVRASLSRELPGARTTFAELEARCLAERPWYDGADRSIAALDALLRQRLGASTVDVSDAIDDAVGDWVGRAVDVVVGSPQELGVAVASLTEGLARLASVRRDRVGVAAAPCWGWIMPSGVVGAAGRSAPQAATAAERTPSSGTEREAPARERIEIVELPEDASADNPLVHTFEKLHTAEEFDGGRRAPSGTDELADHADALSELDLRQVVRGGAGAGSVYRADLGLPTADVDLDDPEPPVGEPLLYDEWDDAHRRYRPKWCRVQVRRPAVRSSDAAVAARVQSVRSVHRRAVCRLRAVIEQLDAGRTWRNRQRGGSDIDLDAVVDRHCEVRAGRTPDDRLYVDRRRPRHDLATLVLIDASLSTDGWTLGRRVLDVERDAVLILAEACDGSRQRVAVAGFRSNTRRDCGYLEIKRFEERWPVCRSRLLALEPAGYTRIGPAIRHAVTALGDSAAERKLLLVVTDGKPTDYDAYEGRHGIGDVRKALQEAAREGIHSHALAIDARARFHLPQMFGAGGFTVVREPSHLESGLSEAFAMLAGRA